MNRIKIILVSGSESGCSYAASLMSNRFVDLVMTVTVSDKPCGRGLKKKRAPVAEFCGRQGLSVFQTDDINSERAYRKLSATAADAALVVDFGQILSGRILDFFPRGAFNVHYSLLPDLRGAAPVRWAILKGYKSTGVTLMRMNERLDRGAVVETARLEIKPGEDYAALKKRLTGKGILLVEQLFRDLAEGNDIEGKAQTAGEYDYAPKISAAMCRVDWNQPGRKIADIIRAMSPAPGCYTFLKKKDMRIKILVADYDDGIYGRPGTVCSTGSDFIAVAGLEGGIRIKKLQPAGRRVMDTGAFLAGNRVKEGDSFE